MKLVTFLMENLFSIFLLLVMISILVLGFWLALRSYPVMPPMKSMSRADMMKYEQENF